MSKKVLQDTACVSENFKFIILKYFNVFGSNVFYENDKLMPRMGEFHEPEIYLIPLLAKMALKKRAYINIYREDFNTFDGSCILDYIHV